MYRANAFLGKQRATFTGCRGTPRGSRRFNATFLNQKPLFSWLHLSDIHSKHGNLDSQVDWNIVLNALETDVNNWVIGRNPGGQCPPKPDVVFVTGDISNTGNSRASDEFATVGRRLEHVVKMLDLQEKDVYLIPGNHDVDRSICKDGRSKELLEQLRDEYRNSDVAAAIEDPIFRKRMKAYLDFSNEFAEACRGKLYWSERRSPNGLSVLIVGLNSALLAQNDEDRHKLRISQVQLPARAPREQKMKELVVVLSHHPFEWLMDSDRSTIEAWVRTHAQIHLSGHTHRAEAFATYDANSHLVHVVAAATHSSEIGLQHGYNVGAVYESDGNLVLRIWNRRYDNHRFVAHTTADGQYYQEFYLRPKKQQRNRILLLLLLLAMVIAYITYERTSKINKAQELYQKYCVAQAAAMVLVPRGNLETDVQHSLRLTHIALHHKWTGDHQDEVFTALRKAGRNLLQFVFDDFHLIIFRVLARNYLLEHGYAELTNAYVYSAPLDALNWRAMKAPRYDDVQFQSWLEVVAVNIEAEDSAPIKFLEEYKRVQDEKLSKDPYPTTMQHIRADILSALNSPESIKASVSKAKSLV